MKLTSSLDSITSKLLYPVVCVTTEVNKLMGTELGFEKESSDSPQQEHAYAPRRPKKNEGENSDRLAKAGSAEVSIPATNRLHENTVRTVHEHNAGSQADYINTLSDNNENRTMSQPTVVYKPAGAYAARDALQITENEPRNDSGLQYPYQHQPESAKEGAKVQRNDIRDKKTEATCENIIPLSETSDFASAPWIKNTNHEQRLESDKHNSAAIRKEGSSDTHHTNLDLKGIASRSSKIAFNRSDPVASSADFTQKSNGTNTLSSNTSLQSNEAGGAEKDNNVFRLSRKKDNHHVSAERDLASDVQDIQHTSRKSSSYNPVPEQVSVTNRNDMMMVSNQAHAITSSVNPVFEQAYGVTQAQLNTNEEFSDLQNHRVQNTFNVNLNMPDNNESSFHDKEGLQQALVEMLREAARRQGLEL